MVSACCILGPYFQWFNKRDVFQLGEACCVYYLPRSIFALYKMTGISQALVKLH